MAIGTVVAAFGAMLAAFFAFRSLNENMNQYMESNRPYIGFENIEDLGKTENSKTENFDPGRAKSSYPLKITNYGNRIGFFTLSGAGLSCIGVGVGSGHHLFPQNSIDLTCEINTGEYNRGPCIDGLPSEGFLIFYGRSREEGKEFITEIGREKQDIPMMKALKNKIESPVADCYAPWRIKKAT